MIIVLLICISCSPKKVISEIELQQVSDEEYGKPLLVLIESDPWLMVIGSDSPSFVLYDSGKIIYRLVENNKLVRYLTILNQNELNEFIKYLSIDESLFDLDSMIMLGGPTDQPTNILYLDIMKKKKIMMYGNIETNIKIRNVAPSSFLDLYDKIKNYRNGNAIEWLPPKIEIMFWDYSYASSKRKWIKGFPDLNSPSTVNKGGLYSVFINGDKYETFINYYREVRGGSEAVEINGRKMAISFRIPFPNVDEIMKERYK
jgi:hypothetical protein